MPYSALYVGQGPEMFDGIKLEGGNYKRKASCFGKLIGYVIDDFLYLKESITFDFHTDYDYEEIEIGSKVIKLLNIANDRDRRLTEAQTSLTVLVR